MKLQKLFTPMKIGNCEIPNRLVVPAMVVDYCTEDGYATDRYIKYHEAKAKGGWGLIITEDYGICKHGKGYPHIAALYEDAQIEGHKKLTDTVHKYESRIFCQLYHPGRQSNAYVNGGEQPVAPSAIPCALMRQLPKELSVGEIRQIVGWFGDAALRAKKAGFDGVEVHAGHGYLLAEFLSPLVNKRSDQYGGSFENRLRIVREVLGDIRSKVGADYPVTVRFSVDETADGGRDIAESRVLAMEFEDMGFDALHVSSGIYSSYGNGIVSTMYVPHAWTVNYAEEIKKLVSIPVITVNRINEPKMADMLIASGKTDFVAMGRGSLADPDLPNKAKSGQYEDIRYCIGCLQGCIQGIITGNGAKCMVNPMLGQEYKENQTPVGHPKKVMVIGAGPGGLQAAVTAAERGHNVTVYEKQEDIGGQFKAAAYPPYKGELATYTAWCRHRLEQLNVPVRLQSEVTEETIREARPDAVVLATGGTPLKPHIPGIDLPHVVTAEDALTGKVPVNDTVVICGGGEVGGETAAFLGMEEKKVTVVEMLPNILKELAPASAISVKGMLKKYDVQIHTDTKVLEIREDRVICENTQGVVEYPAQTVVLAFGYKPDCALKEVIKENCPETHIIGGAVKTSNALDAIQDGYRVGCQI